MISLPISPTVEAFNRCPWREEIDQCEKKDCEHYHFRFSKAAESCGEVDIRGIFLLLASACSMMLDPKSRSEPFRPFIVMDGRRTATPEDLNDQHLTLMRDVAPKVEDPELRARLADLVWVRERDYPMVLLAIEAYLASAARLVDAGNWHGSGDRFDRAANLAAAIRDQDLFDRVTVTIEDRIDRPVSAELAWLAERLMEILLDHKKGDPRKYASFSEATAEEAQDAGSWRRARHYWRLAVRWHALAAQKDAKHNAELAAAETYVSEADANPSALVNMVLLNKAAEAFGRIPDSRDRLDQLKTLVMASQRAAGAEMKQVSVTVKSPDLAKHMEETRQLVREKPLDEALRILADLFQPESKRSLLTTAQRNMERFPMRHLVTSFTLSDNDKVVSRSIGGGATDESKEREAALRVEMYRQADMLRQLKVIGSIEPAREEILFENHPRVKDFELLLTDNPMVPSGREPLFADGLLAGLRGDFVVAAHLLIPQLEHALRCMLEGLGHPTFRIDARDGLQYDHDLNTLLYLSPIVDHLGEDLIFDLRGLLVEQCSTNLRNRIAHGLADKDEISSPPAVYLWWMILHLVSNASGELSAT